MNTEIILDGSQFYIQMSMFCTFGPLLLSYVLWFVQCYHFQFQKNTGLYVLRNRPKSYNDKQKKNVDIPYFWYIQYSCIMIWFYIIGKLQYKIQERFLIIPVLHIHTCWVILLCTSISVMLHLWPFVIVSRWWFALFSTVWAEQWVDHQRPYYEAFEITTEIWPQVILVSHYEKHAKVWC